MRLNRVRQQRWLKKGVLDEVLLKTLASVRQKHYWTIITEPCCGDAAHAIPLFTD
jgi:hypothetical protein